MILARLTALSVLFILAASYATAWIIAQSLNLILALWPVPVTNTPPVSPVILSGYTNQAQPSALQEATSQQ